MSAACDCADWVGLACGGRWAPFGLPGRDSSPWPHGWVRGCQERESVHLCSVKHFERLQRESLFPRLILAVFSCFQLFSARLISDRLQNRNPISLSPPPLSLFFSFLLNLLTDIRYVTTQWISRKSIQELRQLPRHKATREYSLPMSTRSVLIDGVVRPAASPMWTMHSHARKLYWIPR